LQHVGAGEATLEVFAAVLIADLSLASVAGRRDLSGVASRDRSIGRGDLESWLVAIGCLAEHRAES
jgi:hypothetical protein